MNFIKAYLKNYQNKVFNKMEVIELLLISLLALAIVFALGGLK